MIIRLPAEPEARAVTIGWWLVYAPQIVIALAIIWAPIWILGIAATFNTRSGLIVEGVALIAACLAGVIFRSFAVPRWRLWAYERSSDIGLLKDLAIAEQVIRPDDHILSRLEIYLGNAKERLTQLERSKSPTSEPVPTSDTTTPEWRPTIWQHIRVRGVAFLISTPVFFLIFLAGAALNAFVDGQTVVNYIQQASGDVWIFLLFSAVTTSFLLVNIDVICAAPGWFLRRLWLALRSR